jgi:hypothetical protein
MLAVLVLLVGYLIRYAAREKARTGSWARLWQYLVVGALVAGAATIGEFGGGPPSIAMMALALLIGMMRRPQPGED